jgi:hypothetical protein
MRDFRLIKLIIGLVALLQLNCCLYLVAGPMDEDIHIEGGCHNEINEKEPFFGRLIRTSINYQPYLLVQLPVLQDRTDVIGVYIKTNGQGEILYDDSGSFLKAFGVEETPKMSSLKLNFDWADYSEYYSSEEDYSKIYLCMGERSILFKIHKKNMDFQNEYLEASFLNNMKTDYSISEIPLKLQWKKRNKFSYILKRIGVSLIYIIETPFMPFEFILEVIAIRGIKWI